MPSDSGRKSQRKCPGGARDQGAESPPDQLRHQMEQTWLCGQGLIMVILNQDNYSCHIGRLQEARKSGITAFDQSG